MSDSFRDRAARAVGTSPVTATADGARRLAQSRLAAAADFSDMEATRDAARRIRLHTLANLDTYLARFADRVAANGGTVHWAADAEEANRIVTGIALAAGARRGVKSKSMVTEEIDLNRALERAAIDIVETDLGEFIVQLAGDRPSHIVAPVMHKTRHDVGELFRDALGIEYTDDPELLNAAARTHLRRAFLQADIGISGVNFAVAETGWVALVTNEGNGRLTTTAPSIHVAVMGMERIVPAAADLATMLAVLARSATGQKLSSYTTIVGGPRGERDPDGPDQFHVVVVDNGRSRVLAHSTAEVMACIRCGACLNVCPVYRQTGGHAYGSTYSGPIGAVLNPSLLSLEEFGDLAYASTLCGACLDACPVRIDLPTMLVDLRADYARAGLARKATIRALKAFAAAATRPAAFEALLRTAGLLAGMRRSRQGWIESVPGPGRDWTDHRDFPAPAATPFRTRWRQRDGS